jgi:hypothetical protein
MASASEVFDETVYRKRLGDLCTRPKQANLRVDATPEVAKELSVSQSTVRRLLAASEGLPRSYLSETAKVGRLLDLDRCDHVLQ